MDIQNAYNEWSEIYDTNENRTRDLDQKVTRDTLTGQRFNSILELGCGTGKNTAFLIQVGRQVHALDFAQGMIEKAKEKVKAENIRFSVTDLTQRWPCEENAYDLITHHLQSGSRTHQRSFSYLFRSSSSHATEWQVPGQ